MDEKKDEKKDDKKEGNHFPVKQINLLVISPNTYNYVELFKDVTIEGLPLVVEQCSILDISLTVYKPSKDNYFGAQCEILPSQKPLKNTNQHKRRQFYPHFIFFRSLCKGMTTRGNLEDNRKVLFGFMNAGIPAVNSLESVYGNLERVIVHGELRKIQRKLGKENFPLIEQNYHSCANELLFPPSFPCVCKIGSFHAGFGKIVCDKMDRLKDVGSIVSISPDYVTSEKFITADHELRLQKIGKSYRAMKKRLISGWRTNDRGTAFSEKGEIEKKHVLWMDECAKLFNNGMDLLALDVLVDKDGNSTILELNGCAIGLKREYEKEDLQSMKEVVIARIKTKLLPIFLGESQKNMDDLTKEINMKEVDLKNKIFEQSSIIEQLQKKVKELQEKEKIRKQPKKKSFWGLKK